MIYKIKKGWHYSLPVWARLKLFAKKQETGILIFDEECANAIEQIPGWNKLTGISTWKIHKNSGRLVWRAAGSKGIRIAAYVYDNGGKAKIKEIGYFPADEIMHYSIRNTGSLWIFEIDMHKVTMAGSANGVLFQCHPYFGGQSTAPIDCYIQIMRL